jgi:hypothetical protein
LLGRLQGPGPGVRAGSSDGCGRVSLYNHGHKTRTSYA